MARCIDNLTADVLAAEAAGMSYGKWKTLHPHTKDDNPYLIEPPTPKLRQLVCKQCGKSFVPKQNRKNQMFCGDECRRLAGQAQAQPECKQRLCIICGQPITRPGARLYCGNTCKIRAYRQRQAANASQEDKAGYGN